MADDNQQWPSEDEDFDAVHDGTPVVANIEDVKPPENEVTSVPVTDYSSQDHTEAKVQEQTTEDEEDNHESSVIEPETVHEVNTAEPQPETHEDQTVTEAQISEVNPEETQSEEEPQTNEPTDNEAQPTEVTEEHSPEVAENTPGSSIEPDNQAQAVVTQEEVKSKSKSPRKKLPLSFLLIMVLLIAAVGLGLWSWTLKSDNKNLNKQISQLNSEVANPQAIITSQTQTLISKVGKLINLPKGETPTVADVTNASQAKQQSAFFDNAKNGDQVLMYVKAGEAILYRPSTDKIILVAPLNFSNNSSSATSSTATTK